MSGVDEVTHLFSPPLGLLHHSLQLLVLFLDARCELQMGQRDVFVELECFFPRSNKGTEVRSGKAQRTKNGKKTDPALPSCIAYVSAVLRASFWRVRPYSSSMSARFLKKAATS